jgi:hypothetical protein
MAIRGMIPDLVKNLLSANDDLKKHCASAIFKVRENFCRYKKTTISVFI